jgi:hypothetical protein
MLDAPRSFPFPDHLHKAITEVGKGYATVRSAIPPATRAACSAPAIPGAGTSFDRRTSLSAQGPAVPQIRGIRTGGDASSGPATDRRSAVRCQQRRGSCIAASRARATACRSGAIPMHASASPVLECRPQRSDWRRLRSSAWRRSRPTGASAWSGGRPFALHGGRLVSAGGGANWTTRVSMRRTRYPDHRMRDPRTCVSSTTRSLGDAGATPTRSTESTVVSWVRCGRELLRDVRRWPAAFRRSRAVTSGSIPRAASPC